MARSRRSTAAYFVEIVRRLHKADGVSSRTLSVAFVLSTYNGGATSLALIGTASVLDFSPALRAFLIASIPDGV